MNLILKTPGRNEPCADWPVAVVGFLLSNEGHKSVERTDAPVGKVCAVTSMYATQQKRFTTRVAVRLLGGGVHYYGEPACLVQKLLDQLLAGEDV